MADNFQDSPDFIDQIALAVPKTPHFRHVAVLLITFAMASTAVATDFSYSDRSITDQPQQEQDARLSAAEVAEDVVDLRPFYGGLVEAQGLVIAINETLTGGEIVLGRSGGPISIRVPRHTDEPDFPRFSVGDRVVAIGVLLEAGEDGTLPRLAIADPQRVAAAPTVLERVDWQTSGYGIGVAAVFLVLMLVGWRRLVLARERPFRSAFDQAGGAMIIMDHNLKVVEANRAASRLLEKSQTQLKFKQLPQLVELPDGHDARQVASSLRRGERSTLEASVEGRDGATDLDLTFSRVKAGRREYIVALMHDVSRHTDNVAQFKNFHEALLDGMPVEVGVLSPSGKYLYANGLGFEADDTREWVIGKTDIELCRRLGLGADVALRRRAHRRRATSMATTVQFEEVLKSGSSERHVLRMYHPVFEESGGDVAAVASYGVDITDLKQSLKELDQARHEVDKVGRLKESFLENINEEFRAPISGIIGFAEILESEVPDNQREFVNLIERNGRRLMNTLNAVLDLAGLQNNDFSLAPQVVNVVDEINAVIDGCKEMVSEKGLFLRLETSRPEVLCRADQVCLARVVQNLIDNAVKFTEAGGVVVEVDSDDDWVNIRVLDSGAGFDAAHARDVFYDFAGMNADSSPFVEGVGIGLGITKRLVELMRGRIEIESEPDEGSVFSVILPRAFPRRGWYGAGMPRMLVADASSDARTMIEYVLESRLEIRTAGDMESLDVESRRHFYDIILIDVSLAAPDALRAVLEQIRSRYKEHAVPIVAVDSKEVAQRADEFRNLGFDAYLAKPFKKQALVSRVSEIIFLSRAPKIAKKDDDSVVATTLRKSA